MRVSFENHKLVVAQVHRNGVSDVLVIVPDAKLKPRFGQRSDRIARGRINRKVRARSRVGDPLTIGKKMRFTITSVDYAPEELYAQGPIRGGVLRQIPGPDRPDYFVAQLDQPLKWNCGKEEVGVSHLVLAVRWAGGVLTSTMKHTPVNIALVLDLSVLTDAKVDFQKCHSLAIGVADGEPETSVRRKLTSMFER